MRDINNDYRHRMERYQSFVSETEKERLLQELGVTQIDVLRSIVADFYGWRLRGWM